jgi:hypothetical protein
VLIVHSADYKCCVLCVLYRSPDTFADLYVVFECMDLDLDKLGKDTRQSLSLDHVRWFMYEVRCLLVCVHACPVHGLCGLCPVHGVLCSRCMDCVVLGIVDTVVLRVVVCTRCLPPSLLSLCLLHVCMPPPPTADEGSEVHSLRGNHAPRHQARQCAAVGGLYVTEVLAPLPHSRVFQATTP